MMRVLFWTVYGFGKTKYNIERRDTPRNEPNITEIWRLLMMKQVDVASTAGLAALAICDALIKELHRKNLLNSEEIKETLSMAANDVKDKGEKGASAAKLISHLQAIFA